MQDLRIALIQTNQFWEDKTRNLSHYETEFFSKIEPGSCDLIVLPEMFNTSFTMNTTEMAEDLDGDSIKWLQKWAKIIDSQLVATLIVRDHNSFYNRLVIVSEKGIEASYDKRHLFRMADEHLHFTAGQNRIVYTLKGWRILPQVCYDLRFPVYSRNRTVNGLPEYDLALYPANWPERRSEIWSVLLQARAIENQAFCLGVNRVGTDGKGIVYSGDTRVVDPWGKTLYLAPKHKEEVKFLTLSSQILAEIREQFPAYKDAD